MRLPTADRLPVERLRQWKQGERNIDWDSKILVMIAPVVSIRPLHEVQSDLQYWLAKSPTERIAAVEVLRRQMIGEPRGAGSRLQRVCSITSR